MNRKKQKIPTTWNLSSLGKKYNDPDFLKERALHEKKIKAFAKKWKKDLSYLVDAKSLKKALDQYNALSDLSDREGVYLFLSRQINTADTKLAATEKKYIEHAQKLADYIRFFSLSLAQIDQKKQKKFLADKILFEYKNFLKGIFETARFTLSEKEERILSLKSGVSYGNWNSMIEELFANESREVLTIGEKGKRPKQKKNFTQLIALSQSSCSRVRHSAATAIDDILQKNSFFVEKEFNSILENKKINDELRGYIRPDQARIISDDVSFDVVDAMSTAVTENFKIACDYYALKAKLLGKEKIHYNERGLEVFKNTKKYSYEDSVSLVEQSLSRIDPEFADIFVDMYKGGNIDVYPKSGKRGGAFCMYHAKNNPVYVMLNHTEKVRDVLTLAHEMGHAVHGTLAKREISLNYDTPMFMAEVASTFCEGYTFDLLLEQATDKEKLALSMSKLGDMISTISRQIAAYNFECEVHETFRQRGYLPAADIGKIFKKHMKSYMGPSVLQDYGAENWWMYWSHFRSPFYVYTYASGLLIANGMRALLKKDPEKWTEIKEFFYTGTSKTPEEVFSKIGIDITDAVFWQEGIGEMKELLKETKKLAKKLGKI